MAWITFALIFVFYLLSYADKSIAGYSAIGIMEQLHLTPTQWGLVGSSFFWFFAIAGVVGAGLSDKIGTKKMFVVMAIAWSIPQFGALAIKSLPFLVLARVMLGIGEGPAWPIIVSHISKWFPEERRGFIFSVITFGAAVGSGLLTPLMVYGINTAGWRITWAALGLLSLIWAIVWIVIGKEKPQNSHSFTEAKDATAEKSFSDVLGIMLSVDFLLSFLIYFAQIWVVQFSMVWLPAYLEKVVMLSPTQMSKIVAIIGVTSGLLIIAVCTFADRLFKKTRSYRKSYVLTAGISIISGGLFLSLIPLFRTSTTLTTLFICLGQGLAFCAGSIVSVIVSSLLPQRTGLIMGIMSGLVTVAGIISPMVAGSIIQAAGDNFTLGFTQVLLLNSSIVLLSGVLFIIFVKRGESKGDKITAKIAIQSKTL